MSFLDRKSDIGYVPGNRPPVQQLGDVPSSRVPGFYVLKLQIDVLTCVSGNTMQQLYKNVTYCRKCTIQNITTTAATIVTVVADIGSGNGINGTADSGVQLNAGGGQNQGGGDITFGDNADPKALIDASKIYWTADNTSDAISVTLEIPGERLY